MATGGAVVFRRNQHGSVLQQSNRAGPNQWRLRSVFRCRQVRATQRQQRRRDNRSPRWTTLVGSVRVMVRIRKNANTLTPGERDRFVAAFAQLNNQGLGRFKDFRDMHTAASDLQAHRAPGFLPWHRAYLLDLERELQAIDPSVALPYWRFDQPAPNLFTLDFVGVSGANGTVQFSNNNPLQFWTTDNVQGVNRRPLNNWNPATQRAPIVITEAKTLALGVQYPAFRTMEGNPHGRTHLSFGGSISSISTAAKDPLFFLLHCNVDRLWAKWQRQRWSLQSGAGGLI